ncbi:MAG: antitoxin family protein [Caldilineaceae bacterium]
MVKTIPVIYRDGVFVPMHAVDEIAEGSALEIVVYLPGDEEAEPEDVTQYSLEQNLALLYRTSGL